MSQATKTIGILPILQEYSEENLEEALNSQEFLNRVKEETGEEITTQEAKDLVKEYLGEEALDMSVEDVISKYNLSQLK